jgi:hypothetical protein
MRQRSACCFDCWLAAAVVGLTQSSPALLPHCLPSCPLLHCETKPLSRIPDCDVLLLLTQHATCCTCCASTGMWELAHTAAAAAGNHTTDVSACHAICAMQPRLYNVCGLTVGISAHMLVCASMHACMLSCTAALCHTSAALCHTSDAETGCTPEPGGAKTKYALALLCAGVLVSSMCLGGINTQCNDKGAAELMQWGGAQQGGG